MGLPRFTCPKSGDGESSPHLYVANCGPAVGISYETIASIFGIYGEVKGVYAADESGTRVIVSYHEQECAKSAISALNGKRCEGLGGRAVHIQYSVQSPNKVDFTDSVPASTSASELNIPGLHLMLNFVSAEEEEELLAAVDSRPWQHLAKRRVQHYGFEFCYNIRNVDTAQCLGELPSFISHILERISSSRMLDGVGHTHLDQLTVNEYPPGVGLSPHIDTHSAFEGLIFSLSLAGPCIMEFRKYTTGSWQNKPTQNCNEGEEESQNKSNFLKKSIFLPPRSILLLSGEARYAWHHYIPHHKVDKVKDNLIPRASRRVSFTLRKVRKGPCQCEFPEYCDSQK